VSLRSYLAVTDNPEISEERKAVFRKQLLQALATTGEMLDNLLTWAKIQILNKRPLLVPVQVKDCVRDTMWAVSSQAEQKGILLKDHVDNVTVVSDLDSLSIALRNLITNALKFSNEGQTVLIESRQSEKELELIISDQGIGMDASEQEQILQCSALSQMGTKGEKGSGLGLILVHDLLERTNATLTLSSRKGEGSRFSIHLPLLYEAKAPL
jgi:signal transduction histidine kinase